MREQEKILDTGGAERYDDIEYARHYRNMRVARKACLFTI